MFDNISSLDTWVGVVKMNKFKFFTILFLFQAITGCGGGGGGGGNSSTTLSETSINGVAIDGNLAKATVFLDLNDDGLYTQGEPQATTNDSGEFVLSATQEQVNKFKVVVIAIPGVTIDKDFPDTPIKNGFTLVAPPGNPSVVSPLTTHVVAKMNSGKTLEIAKEEVRLELNLSSVDVMKNYVALKLGDESYSKVHNVAAAITEVLKSIDGDQTINGDRVKKLNSILERVTSEIVPKVESIKAAKSLTSAIDVAGIKKISESIAANSNTTQFISEESSLVTFKYYRDGSKSNPVSYIYPKDIDGDGIDEVFFVSFETQPNKPESYSNTSIHILGWVDGIFKEITTTWLPEKTNEVEGVGDLCFGDFNGDGKLDVFLSGYTDMDHAVHPYALMNKGKYFEKVQYKKQTWMHAITCKDINGDGMDDVLVTGYSSFPQYIGSTLGLLEYDGMVGGSGITAGDFLNNGAIQVIVLDADANDPKKDTQLLSLKLDADKRTVSYNVISYLPGPRLDTLYPDANSKNSSHDIRAVAIDFDSDGKLDVITSGYRFGAGDKGVEHRSEIQFLKNKGNGVFEDVTDLIRIDYDMKGSLGYVPVVRDLNGDGKIDFFTSAPDWFSTGYNSTTLFIQSNDGRFVDSKRKELNAYIGTGGQATVARGPGGINYLIKELAWKADELTRVTASKIKF